MSSSLLLLSSVEVMGTLAFEKLFVHWLTIKGFFSIFVMCRRRRDDTDWSESYLERDIENECFFSFLVFNTQLKVYREMFCKSCWRLEWIRTWALWFGKQLLCKLHQCAKREYFFFIILADNLCTSQKFTYLKWSTLFYWQITIFWDRGELDPIMLNCGLQGWQCWWQFNGLEITGDPLKLLRAGMAAT